MESSCASLYPWLSRIHLFSWEGSIELDLSKDRPPLSLLVEQSSSPPNISLQAATCAATNDTPYAVQGQLDLPPPSAAPRPDRRMLVSLQLSAHGSVTVLVWLPFCCCCVRATLLTRTLPEERLFFVHSCAIISFAPAPFPTTSCPPPPPEVAFHLRRIPPFLEPLV